MVREDVRATLRVAWIDPAIDAATASPVFFTAAWSAIRPNVGKSFLALTRALRTTALESLGSREALDLRKELERSLPEEDLKRAEDIVRAAHLATAKSQIVVHALARAAARDPIPGTGREEPPVRRGVPDWQRWIAHQSINGVWSGPADDAVMGIGLPAVPTGLGLLSRWPRVLEQLGELLVPVARGEQWRSGAARLRRVLRTGIETLPHPIALQWSVLASRGITDEERRRLGAVLVNHDRSMADQTLVAAFTWAAFGSPDVGSDG
jgi:hypothetical protein